MVAYMQDVELIPLLHLPTSQIYYMSYSDILGLKTRKYCTCQHINCYDGRAECMTCIFKLAGELMEYPKIGIEQFEIQETVLIPQDQTDGEQIC